MYSGPKTVTNPQDQDFKEGDFFVNFLLLSGWNVPLKQV